MSLSTQERNHVALRYCQYRFVTRKSGAIGNLKQAVADSFAEVIRKSLHIPAGNPSDLAKALAYKIFGIGIENGPWSTEEIEDTAWIFLIEYKFTAGINVGKPLLKRMERTSQALFPNEDSDDAVRHGKEFSKLVIEALMSKVFP